MNKNPLPLTPRQVRMRGVFFVVLSVLVWFFNSWIARSSGDVYVILPVLAIALLLMGIYSLATGRLPGSKKL